jgi:hypothetical protein
MVKAEKWARLAFTGGIPGKRVTKYPDSVI